MTILVFANGDLRSLDWIKPHLAAATAVIAADGGLRHLFRLNQRPDILIGDLDSLEKIPPAFFKDEDIQVIRHPQAKNETDLELALLYATERPDWRNLPIMVFGVIGGRLDQTLANIFLLAHPLLSSRHIRYLEQYQQAWLVTKQTTITGEIGDRVSLIPLGGSAVVEDTTGLEWPLHGESLEFGPARGVSNTLTAEEATIRLRTGLVLCIHTEKRWRR